MANIGDYASDGRSSLQGAKRLAFVRLGIGLVQGLLLYLFYRAAAHDDALSWPATQPPLYGALLLACAFTPVMLLAGVGRLGARTLAIWAVAAFAALALMGWHDAAWQVADDRFRAPFLRFPAAAFAAAALFIAHHLIVPAATARRWIAAYDDYFDTTWKAGVQLALSLGFVGAFWILLFLGAALFQIIGLNFLERLIQKSWFTIPVTCLVFAVAVQLTDVRSGLIRGVRTVALMLLSWLLPVITVLVAGFLAALPFTGLDGLWGTGSATALVLSAVAALIVLINTAYQDGREDNLPPAVLRGAARVASVLLIPLALIAFWGLGLRIGQHGLTPDRIIAAACALIGAIYAGGYGWAAVSPFWRRAAWMQALERTNVVAAVLSVAVILALFSPLADPARLSVADQTARLQRGAVSADDFDYAFLRFDSGRAGMAALGRLAASSDPEIARKAKEALEMSSAPARYGVAAPDRIPVIRVWPETASLPADFVVPVPVGDPRFPCEKDEECMASVLDLDGDGVEEVWLASAYMLEPMVRDETRGWISLGAYRPRHCDGHRSGDPRDALKAGTVKPITPARPALDFGDGVAIHLSPHDSCAPEAVNP